MFTNPRHEQNFGMALSQLTVVNLVNCRSSYDGIFKTLAKDQSVPDNDSFFVGNIAILLDSLDGVKTIQVSRSYGENYLIEETVINY